MKPNIDTFGPGVRRLNPKLFGSFPTVEQSESKEYAPTVKESLSVPTKEEIKSERQLQEQIASLLRNRGIVFQRSRMDMKTSGTVGWPDFAFAVRGYQDFGRPCAFEVKMPDGALSNEQRRCIAAMVENGWDVRVIRSVDEALKALNEMGAKELL